MGRVSNPTGAASARPGVTGASTATHRSVQRNPSTNVAGAARHATRQVNGQGQQAHGNQGAHGNGHHNAHANHGRAHDHRVARAHAKARHNHRAHHRHHSHARWARRAYHRRHHRGLHHWSWWHRPHWPWYSYYYGPWYRPNWAYGVFIYGHRPVVHHTTYVAGAPQPEPQPEPVRKVDRTHKWAVGIRGGSYMSGYQNGPGFGDFGLGISGRYRAAESLGFELSWAHHDQTWTESTERWSEPFAASVQLFAWPWTRFNPYLSAGVTWTDRSYRDLWTDRYGTHQVSEDHVIFGPHGGLGLEFGVGDNASINLEGRLIGYLNIEDEDYAVPSAVQTTAGVTLSFLGPPPPPGPAAPGGAVPLQAPSTSRGMGGSSHTTTIPSCSVPPGKNETFRC